MRLLLVLCLLVTVARAQEPRVVVRDPALGAHDAGVAETVAPGLVWLRPATGSVALRVKQAPLRATLRLLAREGDLALVVGPGVGGRLTLSLEPCDPTQALLAVVRHAGLGLQRVDGVWVVRDVPAPVLDRSLGAEPRVAFPLGLTVGEAARAVSEVAGEAVVVRGASALPLPAALSPSPWPQALQWLAWRTGQRLLRGDGAWQLVPRGPPLRLDAAGCPAASWCRLLAEFADRGLVVSGDITREVDVELDGVDAEGALRATVAAFGGEVAFDAALWQVRLPPDQATGLPLDTDPVRPPRERRIERALQRLRAALQTQEPGPLAQASGDLRALIGPPPAARPPEPEREARRRLRGLRDLAAQPEAGLHVFEELRRALLDYALAGHPRPARRLQEVVGSLSQPQRERLVSEWLRAARRALESLRRAADEASDQAQAIHAEIAWAVEAALLCDSPRMPEADALFREAQEELERAVRKRYAFRHPLTLSATLVGAREQDARCVLNGEVLAVGDPIRDLGGVGAIEGLHLTRIEPGLVGLQLDDSRWTLGFAP